MPAFLTPLEVRVLRSRTLTRRPLYRLLLPLVYQSDFAGRIEVPAGTNTDFASVPIAPLLWWLFGTAGSYAAVVHDWIYQRCGMLGDAYLTKEVADKVFLEAMGVAVNMPELGVEERALPWAPRRAMYAAVVIGGRY